MTDVSLLMVFIEGILTFISPCILPMLPIYFVYLAGASAHHNTSHAINKTLIINTLAFILGFTIIFTLLGASATTIGDLLKDHIGLLRKVGGSIIVIFGLYFIGLLRLNFLNTEKRIHMEFKELGFGSSMLFGMVFSLGWTPCVGPFLGSVLLLAATSETVGKGILLLVIYSVGLGIPFLMSAILFDKLKNLFSTIGKYQRIINMISGIILIIMGVLVFTGQIQNITGYLI
ncbi:cytochrome c biogenesis protein CcdA [Petroclostridium sp. X23]|uniref:cytochrome c biogenesis CcdA family protein n=1 Tax=Petroclostridium sp. X23 TaxID=3045146 RepID=UPI0024AD9F55|nr:cytochrome c biogenesis protein CcdA [Petroclostridium sp. X23]WHH57436.1 cytochrome c biogenesis protein CcdA [Petroclostridium sp. X23]